MLLIDMRGSHRAASRFSSPHSPSAWSAVVDSTWVSALDFLQSAPFERKKGKQRRAPSLGNGTMLEALRWLLVRATWHSLARMPAKSTSLTIHAYCINRSSAVVAPNVHSCCRTCYYPDGTVAVRSIHRLADSAGTDRRSCTAPDVNCTCRYGRVALLFRIIVILS